MIPIEAFAAGGWWVGLSVASVLIAALAVLVVTVITLVNRIERQAASIVDHLTDTGEHTRPLLDLVEANVHLAAIARRRGRWPVAAWGPSSTRCCAPDT